MAKFSEIVYMVLDELKRTGDDSHFTEENVAFLASRARAYLLDAKYAKTNEPMDDDDYQTVCLALEPFSPYGDGGCGPAYLRSAARLPQTLGVCGVRVFPTDYLSSETFSFTSPERLRFAGEGRFLRNMTYAAQGTDGHLVLKSSNPQMKYLKSISVSAVFADPKEAYELSCDDADRKCDWLDAEFPMEESLLTPLIQAVVKELSAVNYTPVDKVNDSVDELNDQAALYAAQRNKAYYPRTAAATA